MNLTRDDLTPELLERFWAKVDTSSCWKWQASVSRKGYGQLGINGSMIMAHRLSYLIFRGYLPEGSNMVCHTCDEPSCCNPFHLYDGTSEDNYRDMIERTNFTARFPGELNGAAKLTQNQVDEMRLLYSSGQVKQVQLAQRYGVSPTQISSILNNKSWVEAPNGSR